MKFIRVIKSNYKNLKQIWFCKNGQSTWESWGPIRDINDFNRDFSDWVFKYFEYDTGEEVREAKDWDEASEILNTVGASASAGYFTIEDDGVDPNDK